MARTAKDITEAELSVLQVLWQSGPASVRQLAESLSTDVAPMQAPTVQKLLERLEAKEWVGRDRSETVQKFFARGDRDDLISQRLSGLAEQLCEGSLTPLLSNLVRKNALSDEQIAELRGLIDELDRKPANRKQARKP